MAEGTDPAESEPRDEELASLLGGAEPLAPPPGAYGAIRKRAARRRFSRAAAGALAVGAVVLALPVADRLGGEERDVVVQPASTPPAEFPTATPAAIPTATAAEPSPGGSLPAVPAAAPCRLPDLDMRFGRLEAGAGNRYLPMIVTNKGDAACRLLAHPEIVLIHPGRDTPATHDGGSTPPVEIEPGESASTVLHWASDGAGECGESNVLDVHLQGDESGTHLVELEDTVIRLCEGDPFTVRSWVPGEEGMPGP
jgi:hypothetical protein